MLLLFYTFCDVSVLAVSNYMISYHIPCVNIQAYKYSFYWTVNDYITIYSGYSVCKGRKLIAFI